MTTSTAFFRKDASEYLLTQHRLKRSPGYLQQIATLGVDRQGNVGPAFRLAGRFPIYDQTSLDEYAQRVISPERRSTAEHRLCAVA
jgi:hypothetical protein